MTDAMLYRFGRDLQGAAPAQAAILNGGAVRASIQAGIYAYKLISFLTTYMYVHAY